jgi:hypothetical protein
MARKSFWLIFLILFSIFGLGAVSYGAIDSAHAPAGYQPQASKVSPPPAKFAASSDILLVQDVVPWSLNSNELAILEAGLSYATVSSVGLGSTDLTKFHCIMYASDQPTSYYINIANNISRIEDFVATGGTLIGHVCDKAWQNGSWDGLYILPGNPGHVSGYPNGYQQVLHITDPGHPVMEGLDDAYFYWWNYSTHGYFTNLLPNTITVLAIADGYPGAGLPTYMEYPWGQGRVLANMQTIEWGYGDGSYTNYIWRPQYLRNELAYATLGFQVVVPYLQFDYIASPQTMNTPFSVTITARKSDKSQDDTFNGQVNLSGTVPVSPAYVTLVNGAWTGDVTLYGQGTNILLSATGLGLKGTSNPFSTAPPPPGNLAGYVLDDWGLALQGAQVVLYPPVGGSPVASASTDANGSFTLMNIPGGMYLIQAVYGSYKSDNNVKVYIAGGQTVVGYGMVIDLHSDMSQNPVILVPDFMGSAEKELAGSLYPQLKKAYGTPDSLLLHDPPKGSLDFLDFSPGWQDLKALFWNTPVRVVDCPWDWRRSVQACVQDYLKPAIAKAQKGNHQQKVNIIAHGMGGLLVRAYIQGDGYQGEIDNFTMVGTPNQGTTNSYFLWEGGDAYKLDEYLDKSKPTLDWVNFNFSTIALLYKFTYNQGTLLNNQTETIRQLLTSQVPGLQQLLPTYSFLSFKGSPTKGIDTTSVNYNAFLANLNADPNRTDRMGLPTDTGKVKVRVYANSDVNTIKDLPVGKSKYALLYTDGMPVSSNVKLTKIGDGNTPVVSATLPVTENWAAGATAKGEHTTLIRENAASIMGDLYPGLLAAAAKKATAVPKKKYFYLTYSGRLQPQVIDPAQLKLGVDYDTGLPLQDIAGAKLTLGASFGSIVIPEPAAGNYTINLKDAFQEDYLIAIGYIEGTKTVTQIIQGMANNNTATLTLALKTGSKPSIKITHAPAAPAGLKAKLLKPNLTTLSWGKVSKVTGYNIYARRPNETFFTLLGTATKNSFPTQHIYKTKPGAEPWLYTVTAVQGGTESFLSNILDNGAPR